MLLTFVKAFLVGGTICMIGQIVINFTHLTNGKILVIFLIAGAILQGLGLYQPLLEFAGAGASIPISGFGASLVKGAVEASERNGVIGAFLGGLQATALGVSVAIVFGYVVALLFTFPIFMMTYLPISIHALFATVEWQPTKHKYVMDARDVENAGTTKGE